MSGTRLLERLSAADHYSLLGDDFGCPWDIGVVAVAEGAGLLDGNGRLQVDAVRRRVERRLHLVPRFRQVLYRPSWGLGWPVWADAQRFNVADHVLVFPLPAPAGEAQLLAACEQLRRQRLDPARPLWQLWLLPGLPGQRVGLFVRMHHAIADGIAGVAALGARGLDHRWVLHVRSSQAFALNLFAPLDEAGRRNVLGYLGHQVLRADPPEFEYSDDSDRLGESSQRSRHQTQVDVMLRGTSASGECVIALIEVKFTETDFSGCSAYDNPANPARDVCQSPGLFGSQPDRCFQLANHGYGRRRYADYLSGVPVNTPSGSRSDGGCLVRRGLNQPMRNLALAHLLLDEAEADRVIYALCAPDGHPTIWRRLDEVRSAFPDTDRRTIRPLAASVITPLHPDGGNAFHQHYQDLGLTPTLAP